MVRILLIIFLLFSLSNCKSRLTSCENSYDEKYQGSVSIGEPYTVKNKTYTPRLDHQYDEIGIASWYGNHFHCRKTANGELFNKNQLSGAHNTLPLPSVARVTNLSNNKSVDVIINDRGPFSGKRIIDLSEQAAIAIGMKQQGLANVRVQFLPDETNKLMNKINSKKKIYYENKPQYEYEINVAEYKDQKSALANMRKISKYGIVHLLHKDNLYTILLVSKTKSQSDLLLKKLTKLGYKKARYTSNI